METTARLSSKGQVTIPKVVREALGVKEGDDLIFRLEGKRAVVASARSFLDLAGTIRVPATKRNASWDDVIRRTRAARARKYG